MRKFATFLLIGWVCGVLPSPAKAEDFVPVGQSGTLLMEVEFSDYHGATDAQELVFFKSQPLPYKIRLTNQGNASFANVQIQTFLKSDGAACEPTPLSPDTILPGGGASPTRTFSISPGESEEFENLYIIPDTLCESSAHLEAWIQYRTPDRMVGTTLQSPLHIRIK